MRQIVRAALLTVALCGLARADGIMISSKAIVAPARTPDQRALIAFDGTTETLVIETTVQGEGRDFAWILPLPAAPRIEASTTGLFPTLETACAAEVVEYDRSGATGGALLLLSLGVGLWISIRWWRRPLDRGTALVITPSLLFVTFLLVVNQMSFGLIAGMKASGASAPSAVSVLARGQVGAFDTATLETRDAAALLTWLDANGFGAPAGIEPVVAGYVREGWVFVASKIRRDAEDDAVRRVHPLAFTFPAKSAVYPMRLTGAGNESVALELFVAGDRRAEADGLAVEHCDRLRIDRGDVHAELARRAVGATVLTKLTGTFDSAAMTRDVALRWTDFDRLQRVFVTSDVAGRQALVPAALAFAALLVAGAIAGRRRAQPVRFGRRDAAWCAVALAAAVGAASVSWANAPLVPGSARVASERERSLPDFGHPPASVVGDAAAVRAWIAGETRGIDNEWTGEPVREEDSPGNWSVREADGRVEVVVYDGDDETAFDCSRRVAVEGLVRTADGAPVAGARVRFQWGVAPYRPYLPLPDVKTDSDGSFRVEVPQGRTWEVVVTHDDHPDLAGTTIDLRNGAIAPVHLTLPPERVLRGRLLDADGRPLAGTTVGASKDHRGQRFATTDADGAFEFRGFDATRATEVWFHLHHEPKCDGKPSWTIVLKPESGPLELRLPK